MESVPAELSPMAQDRRITILEENAKRFDRDLRDVKAEMSEGLRSVGQKVEESFDGSTGLDGNMTISTSGSNLYIENRMGFTFIISVLLSHNNTV